MLKGKSDFISLLEVDSVDHPLKSKFGKNYDSSFDFLKNLSLLVQNLLNLNPGIG